VNLLLDGEWIETTPEHPFYVEGKGWLAAEDLSFGMQVRQADGTTGFVWWKWSVHQTQAMYNLTVATAHTYFVGQGQWLVHNACKPYDVGLSGDLYNQSLPSDTLDIHHAPQQNPASQAIPSYDPTNAPAIVLPHAQHMAMDGTNIIGQYTGSARDLLAKTIYDLRNIDVSNDTLRKLIDLNKKTYPIMSK